MAGISGGNMIKDLNKVLSDIVTDPQKYKEYQRNLAIYAFNEAKKGGYKGNIKQFATTTGITPILTGGNLVFDAVKFGWDKVAKGAVNKAIQAEKKPPRFCKKWKKAAFCK